MASGLPPPKEEYGADEISALVLDPGYSVTRAGFAGEDTPKSIIPTYYGTSSEKAYVFDDNAVHNPTSNLEIRNPMALDGTVEDWDVATKLWEYAITSRLTGPKERPSIRHGDDDKVEQDVDVQMEGLDDIEKPLTEYPLLMTEPGWNPVKSREKMMEIAMEGWGCPAFYLARSGVMASFASGNPSALVVDVGATQASVTAVHDGMILKKGTFKSGLGGNWISDQIRLLFSQAQPPVPLTPHYLIASKRPVDAGAAAQATMRSFATPPHASFRRLQEERVLTEFKESCVQIWNAAAYGGSNLSANIDTAKNLPGRAFEMPDGWSNVFGIERYRAAEGLFDETAAVTDGTQAAPTKAETIPGMVQAALNGVDADLRSHLITRVVVTGGSTLINGFNDRLNFELQSMYTSSRVRIQAPASTVERKYASWIGGSILASLGSFHQMWISKKEYDEFGSGIVEKRCK